MLHSATYLEAVQNGALWYIVSSFVLRICSNCTVASFILQCFDAVGWVAGKKTVKTEWWGAGMVIWLGQGADMHMAQLIPLLLTVSCSRKSRVLVLPLLPAHPGSPRQNPESCKTVVIVA